MKHQVAPNSCSPTWAHPSVDGIEVFVACNKAVEILEVDRASWTLSRRHRVLEDGAGKAVDGDR